MDAGAILVVSGAVVALTQLIKWAGVQDKYGPIAVLALALAGVAFWGYSEGTFERTKAFQYFAGWVAVATSAAGAFGFTRATSAAVTSIKEPPKGGAGGSPTVKDN